MLERTAGAPVRLTPALGAAAPVIFDSPHSGRSYPDDFRPAVPLAELYGYEDRLVDKLIAGAPAQGIALLAALFPRSYIDPNRAEDDLEPEIAGPDWPNATRPLYGLKGIGLIFRTDLRGSPLYERPLEAAEIRRRIELYWRPYHAALDDLLDDTHRCWGAAWHVNWHSMRPVGDALSSDPGTVRPDFVVSDRDGASAASEFSDMVEGALRALGYSTARNQPFKGGYITERHGRPAGGRHSVQVEINRALYLDLDTLELTPGAAGLQQDLERVSAEVAAYARARAPVTPS